MLFNPELYTQRAGMVTDVASRGQNLSIVCFAVSPGKNEDARVHFGKNLDPTELDDIIGGWICIEKVIEGVGEARVVHQRLSNSQIDIVTEPMPYRTFRSLIINSRKAG